MTTAHTVSTDPAAVPSPGERYVLPMTAPPGTYRIDDGSAVAFSAALAAWGPLAHEALIATARRYHAVIT